jgi:hypothetical protein
MKLCVNVLRGCTRWSAFVQDSSHPTPFIGIRLFPPSGTTADCSCLPWSATLRPWKGELLLKSLNTLTLSADLFESLKIAVTICFSGQGSIDVSFPHPYRSQKAKFTQIKYMNDRAIARLKANISRRVKFLQFANRELIEGIVDDLSNVGWHASRDIDWEHCSSELTWYITVPRMCMREHLRFGKAEEDLKL